MPVIYHIVGINNKLKDTFKHIIENNDDLMFVDLDYITNEIRNNKMLKNMYKKLATSRNKTIITREISMLWKELFQEIVTKIINKNIQDKSIVFIGLKTYHRDHKIRIKLQADYQYLLDISPSQSAQNTIEYNLDTYYHFIIKGKFPLIYLNKKFLVEKRERINKTYLNFGFKKQKFLWLVNYFKKMNNKTLNSSHATSHETPYATQHAKIFQQDEEEPYENLSPKIKWYVGSSKDLGLKIIFASPEESVTMDSFNQILKQSTRIKQNDHFIDKIDKNKMTYAYMYNWMAVLSAIPECKNNFIKGFLNKNGKKIPFIEEKYDGAFDALHKRVYLNTLDLVTDKTTSYKIRLKTSINIDNKIFISSAYDYLKNNGIKFIYYLR